MSVTDLSRKRGVEGSVESVLPVKMPRTHTFATTTIRENVQSIEQSGVPRTGKLLPETVVKQEFSFPKNIIGAN
jgi:hypothetical protein